MRKAIVAAIVASSLLVGCAGPISSVGMNIVPPKNSKNDETTLLGDLKLLSIIDEKKDQVKRPSWGMAVIKLSVTDGLISCLGSDENTKIGPLLRPTINLICDDGRTGDITVNLKRTFEGPLTGVGVGRLSDGSKVRLVVGELAGSLDW